MTKLEHGVGWTKIFWLDSDRPTEQDKAALSAALAEPHAQGSKEQPVAWRVKDFADGWILCHTLEVAEHEADGQCLIQPLYAGPIPFASRSPAETFPDLREECANLNFLVNKYYEDIAKLEDQVERSTHTLKTLRERIHESGGAPRYFATPGAALNAAVELADTVLSVPSTERK